MTDFNSTEAAKKGSPIKAAGFMTPAEFSGRVRVARISLPATHGYTLAQNDRIKGPTLPKDARVLGYTATHGAFGSSVVMDIGDANADRFVDGADIAAAGSKFGPSLDQAPLTADTDVYVSLLGANPADNVAIDISLFYVID